MSTWYSRPVLSVEDVERAVGFYRDSLGFTEAWRYAEGGRPQVAQVAREGCELILSSQEPDRIGRGRIFVSLEVQALRALRVELAGKGAPIRDGWWGYETMIVTDPDGNELYFPYPAADASAGAD